MTRNLHLPVRTGPRPAFSLPCLLLAAVLCLGACGDGGEEVEAGAVDDTTTTTELLDTPDPDPTTPTEVELAPDEVVFVWAETGGCAMIGPNCARYEVLADGTVNTSRESSSDIAATGSIDTELVARWIDLAANTDLEALTGRLGPGELTAAFDGVDFQLRAPFTDLALSSVEFEFDRNEPLFALADEMVAAAFASAPLETETRS